LLLAWLPCCISVLIGVCLAWHPQDVSSTGLMARAEGRLGSPPPSSFFTWYRPPVFLSPHRLALSRCAKCALVLLWQTYTLANLHIPILLCCGSPPPIFCHLAANPIPVWWNSPKPSFLIALRSTVKVYVVACWSSLFFVASVVFPFLRSVFFFACCAAFPNLYEAFPVSAGFIPTLSSDLHMTSLFSFGGVASGDFVYSFPSAAYFFPDSSHRIFTTPFLMLCFLLS